MLIKHWFESLVNRAVVMVIAVIILSALIVTAAGSLISQTELEQQARNQVENIVHMVSSELDSKLALRLETLNHIAQSMTMSRLAFNSRAHVLVKQQTALQHLFDGIYLVDEHGTVIAEYPTALNQTGLNVSDRKYFQQASSYLTPVISEPYLSNFKNMPAVMIAAPVFDHHQRFIGLICGAISLSEENFMGDLASIRIGQTGYLGIATRTGITLAHGRTGDVMVPVRIENPVLKDAMEGFEGTRQTVNGAGDKTIMSVRQMAQVPWFVAAIWPAKEAFAPVMRMEDSLIWTLMGVILVIAPLTLWLFRKLMAPLKILAQQINERHLAIRTKPVDVSGGNEIRQVAQIFNITMDERDEVLSSLAEREAFFRSLTQSAPIGIVQTDVLGRIDFVNPAFEAIMQSPGSELQHSFIAKNIYEPDRKLAISGWRKAREEQKMFRGRFRLRSHDDGPIIWGDVMTSVIETPGKVLGTVTVVRDISRELEVEEALKEEQKRAENILGVLQEGVLMVDTTGVIRYANGAACRFVGTVGDCVGLNFFEQTTLSDGDHTLTLPMFLADDNLDNLYVTFCNSSGQIFDIALTLLHIHKGKHNQRMVFVLRDDSERRREEERLSWEATHDSLTQLFNRRAFTASLVKALGEVSEQGASSVLMVIDLDYFKPVNDEGGHLLGDDLLKRLSDMFRAAVRQSDIVARLGGDEFGIILPACGVKRAEELAERIRAGAQDLRIEKDGVRFGVTTSIGLTELSPLDNGPRDVVARADKGCYIAKARGRNTVIVVPSPALPKKDALDNT